MVSGLKVQDKTAAMGEHPGHAAPHRSGVGPPLTEAAPLTPDEAGGSVPYLSHERQQHSRLELPARQQLCDPLQLLLRVPWML